MITTESNTLPYSALPFQVFTPEQIKGLQYETIIIHQPFKNRIFNEIEKVLKEDIRHKNADYSTPLSQFFVSLTRAERRVIIDDAGASRPNLKSHFRSYLDKSRSEQSSPNSTNHRSTEADTPEAWEALAETLYHAGQADRAKGILQEKLKSKFKYSDADISSIEAKWKGNAKSDDAALNEIEKSEKSEKAITPATKNTKKKKGKNKKNNTITKSVSKLQDQSPILQLYNLMNEHLLGRRDILEEELLNCIKQRNFSFPPEVASIGYDMGLYLISRGYKEALTILLDRGLSTTPPAGKKSLLSVVISSNANEDKLLDIAQLLIDRGADVNAIELDSEIKTICTPLFYATLNSSYRKLKLLLENGAKTDIAIDMISKFIKKDFLYMPPLHMACQNKDFESADLLIQHKADLNSWILSSEKNSDHLVPTVLMLAVSNLNYEIVKFLTDRGAVLGNDDGCRKIDESSKRFEFLLVQHSTKAIADREAFIDMYARLLGKGGVDAESIIFKQSYSKNSMRETMSNVVKSKSPERKAIFDRVFSLVKSKAVYQLTVKAIRSEAEYHSGWYNPVLDRLEELLNQNFKLDERVFDTNILADVLDRKNYKLFKALIEKGLDVNTKITAGEQAGKTLFQIIYDPLKKGFSEDVIYGHIFELSFIAERLIELGADITAAESQCDKEHHRPAGIDKILKQFASSLYQSLKSIYVKWPVYKDYFDAKSLYRNQRARFIEQQGYKGQDAAKEARAILKQAKEYNRSKVEHIESIQIAREMPEKIAILKTRDTWFSDSWLPSRNSVSNQDLLVPLSDEQKEVSSKLVINYRKPS